MTVLHPNGKNLTYKFAQFHFHSPAEHLLDGVQYDGELHLVHTRTADDGSTEYAVLCVFLDASKDIESGLIERLQLETLPL
jgi:carbonic anhydrase